SSGRQHDLAAGGFDGGDRRFRGARDLEGDTGLEFALGKEAHAVAGAAQYAGGDQLLRIDRTLGAELAGIQRLLHPAEVHDRIVLAEYLVVEAALRESAVQRGLAALEAVDRDPGARRLA